MLRIAFFLDTQNVRSIDIRDVDAGNPGMGGTEYMFFLVAAYLAKSHAVTMYVTTPGRFPEGITYREVRDLNEAADHLEIEGPSILILRESEVLPNLRRLDSMKQKVLVWAHNYSGHRTLKACVKCPSIARYLCVSREQYENLRDEAVFAKADYVYNAAVTKSFPSEAPSQVENDVFYMGSLIEAKGFHILAKYWPEIASQVPGVRLHVIGSGQLYNREVKLGPLRVASPEYERLFAGYLTENGQLRADVIFHGTLGAGKAELLKQAKVAVANPTGVGETFCITALEFGLLGVPVVTKNEGGPRNVVSNGQTGMLYDHERELPKAVVHLLTHEALRREMGRKAMTFTREQFDIQVVIQRWERILQEVHRGVAVIPDYGITAGSGPCKRLKEVNRKIKSARLFGWLPSIDYWIHAFVKKKNSWIVNPIKRAFLQART
jgi:glycosyltransferase involved in cell wall biosynthesis